MIHVLSPGDPDQRTGGYLYNARVVEAWRASGHPVTVHRVEGRWPLPGGTTGLPEVSRGDLVLADGLLWTGLGAARRQLGGARTTVLVHLALHEGGGVRPAEREALRVLEAQALDEAAAVVVTGEPTRRALGRDVTLVPPGLDPVGGHSSAPSDRILTVASVTRRKRLPDLARLLASTPGWSRWSVAGSPTREPDAARDFSDALEREGIADRVVMLGELDEVGMREAYLAHGLLLHGATHEPYGMAVQEAIAHGLAVVTRPAGALHDAPRGAWRTFSSVVDGPDVLAGALRDAGVMREAARTASYASWAEVARSLLEVMHG